MFLKINFRKLYGNVDNSFELIFRIDIQRQLFNEFGDSSVYVSGFSDV